MTELDAKVQPAPSNDVSASASPVPVGPESPSGPGRTLGLRTDGPDQTRALAAAMAPLLDVGDLLVLTGDLGAGKTCLTQGLGRGLGIEDRITSPTFTLAARYRGRLTLHHLDVYRLDSASDAMDLDLPDLLDSGVTVVEWGDRILSALPASHLTVALRYPDPPQVDNPVPDRFDEVIEETGRLIRLEAQGDSWARRWPGMVAALSPWTP